VEATEEDGAVLCIGVCVCVCNVLYVDGYEHERCITCAHDKRQKAWHRVLRRLKHTDI
jgi:hypothetical protein